MAENEAVQEGKKIARNYLSKLGWNRTYRQTVTTEIHSAWSREGFEKKFRLADELEGQAEAELSAAYDRLRKTESEQAKETLRVIYEELKNKQNLSFIGKRIVGVSTHIKT